MARPTVTTRFSLGEARGIVGDLFIHRPAIYWADFLITILLGYALFAVTRALSDVSFPAWWQRLLVQGTTFALTCLCYYRAVMFIHEVAHLPQRGWRAFRVAWNLLCGIPFLTPSFTYDPHLDHHRRARFGTEHDGEYLPLARLSPGSIALYLSQCLWVPLLAVARFGLLAPMSWLSPVLRRFIHRRASTLVMDPSYIRPLPTPQARRAIFLQELACFAFICGCAMVPPLVLHRSPLASLMQAYAVAAVVIFLNSVRTLASHRWTSDGEPGTFVAQLLDSVTIDSHAPLAVAINPVGLRYHATHHLFPSLPYHNLAAAHRRLMERLPADSPYRLTVEPSIFAALAGLLRRVRARDMPPAIGSGDLEGPHAGRSPERKVAERRLTVKLDST